MRWPPYQRISWLQVLAILSGVVLWVAPATAESLAVIVNKNNPITSLSTTTVAAMYRGETLHWPEGDRVKLVNREIAAEARKVFYLRALNAKPNQVFYRQGTPIPVQSVIERSDDAVIHFVETIESAIGYVALSHLKDMHKDQVKVILIIEDR